MKITKSDVKKASIIILLLFACYLILSNNNIENFKLFSLSSNKAICSKKCCAIEWPTPIQINDDQISINDIGFDKKYNTSNLNCNDNIKDSGCICAKN